MDFDPRATVPTAFGWLVGDFPEEWGHGVSVFHNPNAVRPIPVDFFEGFSGRHWFEDGRYENLFRDFTPNASITAVYSTERYRDRLEELNDLLRREAEMKAQQFAAALRDETKFLAWRDRFVD